MDTVHRIPLPYIDDSSAIFQLIADKTWPIWLDSGKGFNGHHIDILAADPITKLVLDSDTCMSFKNEQELNRAFDLESCFELVDKTLNRHSHTQPNGPGWIGFLSYDLFCKLEDIPKDKTKPNLLPLVCLGFYGYTIVSNHLIKETSIYTLPAYKSKAEHLAKALRTPPRPKNKTTFEILSGFKPQIAKEEYQNQFNKVKQYIKNGDTYQVNLTQQFTATCNGNSYAAFKTLREEHSSPMSAFFQTDEFEILSMSPERFIKVKDANIATQPIKGTRARGESTERDNQLIEELKASDKDRAENVMIVDLLRNDLGRVCNTGSVITDKLFDVETYPNVHHLVSTISGTLTDQLSTHDLIKAVFPGGSITGAPKVRAMEIIEELEAHRRGIYCGSFFHFCGNGDIDSNIAIRTLLKKDNEIHCWGGGGIVADSACDKEYQETWDKVGKLMSILFNKFHN